MALLAASQAKELFNGKDLDGWSGDPRLWSVENGVMTGKTDSKGREVKQNSFLIYQGDIPDDFEISFKARVSGNNSGLQYRSRMIDEKKWRLGGYQMDIHANKKFLGMVYEEAGRGIVCKRGEKVVLEEGQDPKVLETFDFKSAKVDRWNQYKVVAQGHVLKHYVNGELAIELTDKDQKKRRTSGHLGLQLHKGSAMVAEFKDIVLTDLTDEGAVSAASPESANVPIVAKDEIQWIWAQNPAKKGQKVFFRKEYALPSDITVATIEVACDNAQRTWINGHDLGMHWGWGKLARHDVKEYLVPGQNVVAVEGRTIDEQAGLAVRFAVEAQDGRSATVVSDNTWNSSLESSEGWLKPGFEGEGWQSAREVATMGDEPWGATIIDAKGSKGPVDMTSSFNVLPGFKLEKLRDIPAKEGSWVAMTVGPNGDLICGDQYGKIYRYEVTSGKTEALDVDLDGAHGLLYFNGSLYVTVTESKSVERGVYRAKMTADYKFSKPELLKKISGGGEHGPHSLVLSPDKQWIYFCAGNSTKLAKMDSSHVPEIWDEDQLLPRRPDPRGHAANKYAPGGWIARFRPDGSNWQLMGIGLRNEYDIAFDRDGSLFTYDADMEWDLGMPWYRPTRINHVIPGAEFGWRNGTGKWPAYYEDSMPGVIDLGPGSPTGLLSGQGAAFPARYQSALYALDWTFATIYVIHLEKTGNTYTATREELVSGDGLPLTDGEIGADGAMYFTTGGRRTGSALWRVTYVGDESIEQIEYSSTLAPEFAGEDARAGLSSSDRTLRQQARIYYELNPSQIPRDLGQIRGKPWETIQATIISARLNKGSKAKVMLPFLAATDFEPLDVTQKLAWLRAAGLVFTRGEGHTKNERAAVLRAIDSSYPSSNDDVNAELVRVLAYLNAPGVIGRTLTLMDSAPPPVAPDWAAVAERNTRYGKAVKRLLKNQPPDRIIHYVYALRTIPGPWAESERRRFFTWLQRLNQKSGGNSYVGFLKDLTKQTLDGATKEERKWLKDFAPVETVNHLADLPRAKGPGRVWTVEEIVSLSEAGFANADRKNGSQMFKATLCAACHSFGGQGGAAGPDLSTVSGRFTFESLAEALIEPSKEVSDQYAFDVIKKADGQQVLGRIKEEKDDKWIVAINPFDFSQTVEVERGDVRSVEKSPISPMPGGLINQLNEDEMRDLLAYLMNKE